MSSVYEEVFDLVGMKRVSKTDKEKKAYVPSVQQRAVLAAANVEPAHGRVFQIKLLGDPVRSVSATYYNSMRATDLGRPVEPRMGREIISSWLEIDDVLVLGVVGSELFASKTQAQATSIDSLMAEIASKAAPATILAKALKARGKPKRVAITSQTFVRNLFVVQAALIRAKGMCEMPGCSAALFKRDDGRMYLEVHHITPLGEQGDDTLKNAAALCPHCHRQQHFGQERHKLRKILRAYVEGFYP